MEKKEALGDFLKRDLSVAILKLWNLEASAGVRKLPDPVQNQVNHLLCGKLDTYCLYLMSNLANGVVAPGVVVRGVLLAVDQLLRVEQLPVGSSPLMLWSVLHPFID